MTEENKPKRFGKNKIEKVMQPTIGEWADYINYDPDGIAGPPTLRDEKFERFLFGDWVVDLVNERKNIAGSGPTEDS